MKVEALSQRIEQMHKSGAVHRSGVRLDEVTIDMASAHLVDELGELRRAYARGTFVEQLDEAGDMLDIVLHLFYLMGLPLEHVVYAGDRKLTQRFS
ncbi:MAG: hypothetical protein AB7I57_26390, partial [Pirellulales bacterium]